MFDIIIIGMGIGGITAGIYAKRAGKNILMFEKNIIGGTLIKLPKINNYPGFSEISGTDLALKLIDQVNSLEIPYKNEEVIKIEKVNDNYKVITKKGEYLTKSIIIATGRTPKFLGIDNEKDYLGHGLSTCATCDGYFYKDEDVVVVGSGNSALTESLYLAGICNKVYLLRKTFKADKELVDKVNDCKNIKILANQIKKINEENGKISSVVLDDDKILNVKAVFIYVGFRPDSDIFKDLGITNENGDILVNENYETKLKNIYAIGDVIKKDLYQLVTASSDGAKAATNISKK